MTYYYDPLMYRKTDTTLKTVGWKPAHEIERKKATMSPDFYTPLDYAISCLKKAREDYRENSDYDSVENELEIAKQSINIAAARCHKAKLLFGGNCKC